MKGFLIALQFLTALPLEIKGKLEEKELVKSMLYFPVAGLLIGSLLAGLNIIMIKLFAPAVSSALVIILLVIMTGGLHLDGFADTCDGFYAGKNKNEILEIMHDSHTGVMGTVGLICLILLKFTLVIDIQGSNAAAILIIMAITGRWAMACMSSISLYAGSEGTGRAYVQHSGINELLGASFICILCGLLIAGLKFIPVFLSAALAVLLLYFYFKKKIRGVTGDTLGATDEVIEIIVLIVAILGGFK